MSDVVIRAEGLGKKYVIGHNSAEKYTTLRDVLARQARGVARSFGDLLKGRAAVAGDIVEDFWALRGVDFDIHRGDVVGVIGRNGAGKSTLLKILSRITEPTEGRVTIRGRVASLLEVGTGFHPELTGRENVYLNGAILGMTRGEIRRKFDEIVAFAEIERFLDTPVKRYSSGMYVRLAFAVAAHLEPEILIVDEVLAVGDAEFQKKCLGKMKDVSGNGRTVLFVSHNVGAVQRLCNTSILLKEGKLDFAGTVEDGIARYIGEKIASRMVRHRAETSTPYLVEARIDLLVNESDVIKRRIVVTSLVSSRSEQMVNFDLRITDALGAPVAFATMGNHTREERVSLRAGTTEVSLSLDVTSFAVGRYNVSIDIGKPSAGVFFDKVDEVLYFDIEIHHWIEAINPTQQRWAAGSLQLPLLYEARPALTPFRTLEEPSR